MSSYARANLRITNEKQKENSHEAITWSEMGKQNVQAEKVYYQLGRCPKKIPLNIIYAIIFSPEKTFSLQFVQI